MTDQLSAGETDAPRDRPGAEAPAGTDDTAVDESADHESAEDKATEDEAAVGAAAPTSALERWRDRRRRRVTKWDRPPEPHDWRFYVGNLGKILIATGLLMLGFVAYQLWGTGIETSRAQNRLENEFQEILAASTPDDGAPDDSTVDARPADEAQGSDARAGGATDDPTRSSTIDDDEPSTDDIAAAGSDDRAAADADGEIDTAAPADLADEAVEQDIPDFERGDPLALLEIPAIGRSDIVVPGVSLSDLKSGPGHYPDTPLPGQLGNASIAGHRTTYGAPFFDVDQLRPGDELIVTMTSGDRFVYEVTGSEVVSASDYWVVTTRDPTIAELTLTSCHPKYTARDRIVVRSILNPAKSSNVGVPTFYELDEGDDASIPGDDPVVDDAAEPADEPATDGADDTRDDAPDDAPDDAVNDTADLGGDDAATTGPADDDAGATETGDGSGTLTDPADDAARGSDTQLPTSPGDVEDAFGQTWFEDPAAWPQIALWAGALIVVALLARHVSRRYRSHTIGVLVTFAPFLVTLYFFYQNVNRLLPPGL